MKFDKVRLILKLGAIQNKTLGEYTDQAIYRRSNPLPRYVMSLSQMDLTEDDLKDMGFKITKADHTERGYDGI